ncbi:rhomboid family intramembrane serine protease [Thermococcus waiotapuensis]|uniref:Rhomboid family intramembrane serine protease n=1 Tax=Thermococcus waiotapuensis TaxID=90909 RepID=A0AAE4NVG0_9EURY|nr:rhomboid family intramembrane serine protease [Thermococcus waiotapuensis]MDV3103578.1 rhomboid family intramembrane serine protease [Thermococcus waiotapuensis]
MTLNDLYKAIRHAWLTYTIAAINFLVFGYELYLSGGLVVTDRALLRVALVNYLVIYYHEYWRLVSAIFVHLDWIHLAMNTFFLLYLGSQLEILVGRARFLVLYLTAGIFGNLLTLKFLGPFIISGGASGALFGIAGALIMIEGTLKRNIQMALGNAFFLFLINSWLPGVNWVAHLGGLIVGLAFGYNYGIYVRRKIARMEYWDLE